MERISIVTPVYCANQQILDFTEKLYLKSLGESSLRDRLDVILVDDAAPLTAELEGVVARSAAAEGLNIRVLRNSQNRGFAYSVNRGVEAAENPFVAMSNNDIYVQSAALERLLETLTDHPRVGAVGPLTNNAGGYRAQQRSIAKLKGFSEPDSSLLESMQHAVQERTLLQVNWLAGFLCLFRKEAFEACGRLDERFGLGYHEESDLCARLRKHGYDLVVDTGCFVYHVGNPRGRLFGPSMGTRPRAAARSFVRNYLYFTQKNGFREGLSLAYDWHVRKEFRAYEP